jgi:hypothetical protein
MPRIGMEDGLKEMKVLVMCQCPRAFGSMSDNALAVGSAGGESQAVGWSCDNGRVLPAAIAVPLSVCVASVMIPSVFSATSAAKPFP